MLEVRETEVALRKLSGGTAQLRTLEEHWSRVDILCTHLLHLLHSSFRWGSLGYGGLLWWVAVQKRLKTTVLPRQAVGFNSLLQGKSNAPVSEQPAIVIIIKACKYRKFALNVHRWIYAHSARKVKPVQLLERIERQKIQRATLDTFNFCSQENVEHNSNSQCFWKHKSVADKSMLQNINL